MAVVVRAPTPSPGGVCLGRGTKDGFNEAGLPAALFGGRAFKRLAQLIDS